MESQRIDHKDKLLNDLSGIIEASGSSDTNYNNLRKSEDIMDVLENLLAYTITLRCTDADEIRDACEAAYVSLKKRALIIHKNTN